MQISADDLQPRPYIRPAEHWADRKPPLPLRRSQSVLVWRCVVALTLVDAVWCVFTLLRRPPQHPDNLLTVGLATFVCGVLFILAFALDRSHL
jgi:hypothetical protein